MREFDRFFGFIVWLILSCIIHFFCNYMSSAPCSSARLVRISLVFSRPNTWPCYLPKRYAHQSLLNLVLKHQFVAQQNNHLIPKHLIKRLKFHDLVEGCRNFALAIVFHAIDTFALCDDAGLSHTVIHCREKNELTDLQNLIRSFIPSDFRYSIRPLFFCDNQCIKNIRGGASNRFSVTLSSHFT